jgi:protein-S-isoprenylcysteine O-methyltransferase Ste14
VSFWIWFNVDLRFEGTRSMPPADRPSDQNLAERPAQIPWPPLLLLGVIAAAILLGYVSPLAWPGLNDAPAHAIGLGLGAAGIVLLVYAILTLRRHGTTVRPDQGASALVTDGPYRRFRNPIYLADCLILLGIAEVTQNVWFVVASLLFALLVTWLAILPEERHLERRFGDAYLAYKASSRRWI